MRVILTTFLALGFSLTTLALPAPPGDLILGLTKNPEFANLIAKNKSLGVSVTVVKNISVRLRRQCREFSRSASFLRVKIDISKPHSLYEDTTYYFSTPESADDLKLCS